MREPTNPVEDYQWWRDTLDGKRPPLDDYEEPRVGWYKRRLYRNGPWVPVVIWRVSPTENEELTSDETLHALQRGAPIDPYEVWTWVQSKPISVEEYNKMMGNPIETSTTAKPAFPGD